MIGSLFSGIGGLELPQCAEVIGRIVREYLAGKQLDDIDFGIGERC